MSVTTFCYNTNTLLEKFDDERIIRTDFPAHMILTGKVGMGKTYLAAEILNNIDQIYTRNMDTYVVVILSPYNHLQEELKRNINSVWTIIYYQVHLFNGEIINKVLKYLAEKKLLGLEIFMLIDDLAIAATFDTSVQSFLVRVFAEFRNKGISIIATVQSDNSSLLDIFRNSTYVIIMQGFGAHRTLAKVLREFVGINNVPSLIRNIQHLLEEDRIGAYYVVNLSDLANRNRQFTLANTIFDPEFGFTRRYLQEMSQDKDLLKGSKGSNH